MHFNTDLAQAGISPSCIVTFKIAFYLKWKKGGDFAGHLELRMDMKERLSGSLKYMKAEN